MVRAAAASPDVSVFEPDKRIGKPPYSSESSTRTGAQDAPKQSELVKETPGKSVFRKFLDNKREEWEIYSIQVTDYELQKYLPVL